MMMGGGMAGGSSSTGSTRSYSNGGGGGSSAWYSGQYTATENSSKADEKGHGPAPMARNLALGVVGVALVVIATTAAWLEKRVRHSFRSFSRTQLEGRQKSYTTCFLFILYIKEET